MAVSFELLDDTIFNSFEEFITNVPKVALENHSGDIRFKSIKSAFEEGAEDFNPSLKMVAGVINYSKDIKSRGEHINFFGGNLLGVDRIRFYTTDRDRWFDDILLIDEDYLRECVHAVPAVNSDWNVASDVFNISCVWACHQLINKFGLNNKKAYDACVEILVMMQFRFLTSIYSNYFRRPVDNEAAEATYAALSLKFKIRQLGSWGAVLRDRAEAFLSKDSPHYETFQKFDDDLKVIYVVTDMQTRTRKLIKDQYAILDKVRSGNLRIQTTSATLVLDGDKILRDRVSTYNSARIYLFDVSGNQASFIKRELVEVVLDMMTTVSEQAFVDLLCSIANSTTPAQRKEVEWMMETTLQHAFDHIVKNRIKFNDLQFILTKMRALYMSSKSTDPTLLELRARIERYAKRHSKLHAPAALASARTSIMLYFLLRALAANAYT